MVTQTRHDVKLYIDNILTIDTASVCCALWSKPWSIFQIHFRLLGFLLRWSGFDSGPLHVRYVVDKVALRQQFLSNAVFHFPLNSTTLHSHLHLNGILRFKRTSKEARKASYYIMVFWWMGSTGRRSNFSFFVAFKRLKKDI
jgi:hypothetical protein